MKIVADENIPFAESIFGPVGSLTLLPGRHIQSRDLEGCDALIVRSVTKVDEDLLGQHRPTFVGTCTIGVDHLDTAFLHSQSIRVASAPGCNANAVVHYVLSALAAEKALVKGAKACIVGGGNVGSRVYSALTAIGLDCHCVDPFLENVKGMRLSELDEIAEMDIVCLHTPLTHNGPHPTFHMLNAERLAQLKPGCLLLNAGRGEVVDGDALLVRLRNGSSLRVVLDVWPNEPAISPELHEAVAIGTPHIAGYSFEGRVQGALMIFHELAKHVDLPVALREQCTREAIEALNANPKNLFASTLSAVILSSYDARRDDTALRACISHGEDIAQSFDLLRKQYPQRRELGHYRANGLPPEEQTIAQHLGFQL